MMMRATTIAGALMAGAVTMAVVPASAEVITFEDLAVSGDVIANGYNGLDWTNMFAVDPALDVPVSGFANGIASGRMVAYNGYGEPVTIAGAAGFVLNSGWFTAGWNDGLTITAKGYDGATLVHTRQFAVDTTARTLVEFDWRGITSVTFSAEGGVDRFYDMSGTNFALDDLMIGQAVPEPTTWAMMLLGVGLVGGAMRRRTTKIAFAR